MSDDYVKGVKFMGPVSGTVTFGDPRTDGSERPSFSTNMLDIAHVLALRSTCPSGARHGAVIVLDRRIVATGYGSPPEGSAPCERCWLRESFEKTGVKDWSVCPSNHAEANAVANAARTGARVEGGVVFVTKRPCGACLKLLQASGLNAVVFANEDDQQPMVLHL